MVHLSKIVLMPQAFNRHLDSDWSNLITRPEYWRLIGPSSEYQHTSQSYYGNLFKLNLKQIGLFMCMMIRYKNTFQMDNISLSEMTINIYCCHEDCNVVWSQWDLSVHTKSFDPFNLKTGKKNPHNVVLH